MKKRISLVIVSILVVVLTIASVMVLASCKGDTLSLKGIRLDDGKLSFNADSVLGIAADKYTAFANGVEKRLDLSDNGTRLSVNLAGEIAEDPEEIKVEVKAEDGDLELDQTIVIRKLPKLEVAVKNGAFDWSESAAKYESIGKMVYDVYLDGKNQGSTLETSYKTSTGEYHVIKVRPRVVDDNSFYFSNWSDEASSSVLPTPSNFEVNWHLNRDPVTGAIREGGYAEILWGASALTSNVTYTGFVNGIEFKDVKEPKLDTRNIAGVNVDDGFSICIKAISGVPGIDDSAMSDTYQYVSLDVVRNITMDEGIVTFDAVKNAAKYKIRVEGDEYICTDTQYKINTAKESIYITVAALPDDGVIARENWAEAVQFNIVNGPTIKFDSKAFIISGTIQNIKGYDVRIKKEVKNNDGEDELEIVGVYRLDTLNRIFTFNQYGFEEEGRYFVDVKAIAMGGSNYLDSEWSKPYEVIRLGTIPGVKISEDPTNSVAEGYMTITIDELEQFAEESVFYELSLDGTSISATSGRKFNIPKPRTYDENTYTLTIRATAKDSGSATKVVLSSKKSVSFTIVKLAAPRDIELKDETEDASVLGQYIPNSYVTWTMPDPNNDVLKGKSTGNQYSDELADFQIVMGQSFTALPNTGNKFGFAGKLGAGIINVKVYARSRSTKNSQAYTGITTLRFDVNEKGETVVKKINNENSEDGSPVIVLSSDYSNVETMIKLNAPTDLTIQDRTLSWTGVQDAYNGYDVLFALGATEDGNNLYGKVAHVLGTNFSIDDLKGKKVVMSDKTYDLDSLLSTNGCVISVVACGNRGNNLRSGDYFSFDSSLSSSTSTVVFKLDVPTGLKANDTNIMWDSVDYASAYRVYVVGGDKPQLVATVKNNVISTDMFRSYQYATRIAVQAVGDGGRLQGETKYFTSDMPAEDDEYVFYRLEDLTIKRVGDVYAWKAARFAVAYQIEIDGKTTSVATDWNAEKSSETTGKNWYKDADGTLYYYYKPTFTRSGDYTIKVKAIANNGQVVDEIDYEYAIIAGEWSEFVQTVKKVDIPVYLAGGTFSLESEDNAFAITANITDKPRDKCKYKFVIGTVPLFSETKTYSYKDNGVDDQIESGEYIVSVGYAANFFDDDEIYYLDSDLIGAFKFVYLKRPYELLIGQSSVTWSRITDSSMFRYQYEIYQVVKNELNGKFENGEKLFTSDFGYTNKGEARFDFDLKKDLGDDYNNYEYVAVKAYVVSIGNGIDSISDYRIADSGIVPVAK